MRRSLRGKQNPSPALAFGKLWHTILEWHYRTNGDTSVVVGKAMDAGIDHDHPDDYRTVERAILEYGKYVKKWGRPSEEAYQTVGMPDSPMIEIAANVANDDLVYPYAVKIDRIIERDGQYFVEDYKTSSRADKFFFRKFKLDNQMRGYAYAASLIIGKPIAGVRVSLLVARKSDSDHEREIIYYSKDQLEEWKENYNNSVRDLLRSYETGVFRANYTDGGCSGKYGLCTYHDVCSIRPALREAVLARDFEYNPWNPLETEDDE